MAVLGVFPNTWAADPAEAQLGSALAEPPSISVSRKPSQSAADSLAKKDSVLASRPKIKPGYCPFRARSVKEGQIRGKVRGDYRAPLPEDIEGWKITSRKRGDKLYIEQHGKKPFRNDALKKIEEEVQYCKKNRKNVSCTLDLGCMKKALRLRPGLNLGSHAVEIKIKRCAFLDKEIEALDAELQAIPLEANEGLEPKKKEKKAREVELWKRKKEGLGHFKDVRHNYIKKLSLSVDVESRGLTKTLLEDLFSRRASCQSLEIQSRPTPLEEEAFWAYLPRPRKERYIHEDLRTLKLPRQVDLESLKLISHCAPGLKEICLCDEVLPSHLEYLAMRFPNLERLSLREYSPAPLLGLSLYRLTPFFEDKVEVLKATARCVGQELKGIAPFIGRYIQRINPGAPLQLLDHADEIIEKGEQLWEAVKAFLETKISDQEEEGLVARLSHVLAAINPSLEAEGAVRASGQGQSADQSFPAKELEKSPSEEDLKKAFSYFPHLKELEIRSGLDVMIPLQKTLFLSRLKSLRFLKSSYPQSDRAFTEALAECDFSSLEELEFSQVRLKGLVSRSGLGTFKLGLKAPCLKVLRLSSCYGLRASELKDLLEGLPSLRELHLRWSLRRAAAPGAWKEPLDFPADRSLQALSLCSNYIDDHDLAGLFISEKSREKLEVLDLTTNKITAKGLKELVKKRFPVLKELILADNDQIGTEGLDALINAKHNFPEMRGLSLGDTVNLSSDREEEIYRRKLQVAFPRAVLHFW